MKTIQQLRQEKGLTQFELAYQSKVSTSTISKIELGVRICTPRTLIALARVLGVDPNEIEGVVVKQQVGKARWEIVERPFNVAS